MRGKVVRMMPESTASNGQLRIAYKTALGRSVLGKAEDVLQTRRFAGDLDRQVDLIFTSPPFPA